MDDSTLQHLKSLFHEKILRYNDLHRCFEQEKTSLIDIDVDDLWDLSRKKDEICCEINAIRQQIQSVVSDGPNPTPPSLRQVIALVPSEDRREFQTYCHTIDRLKAQIDGMRKENKDYVDHSLRFLDEIISVIAGETLTQANYNEKRVLSRKSNTVFLSREV